MLPCANGETSNARISPIRFVDPIASFGRMAGGGRPHRSDRNAV
jgi:hypothetical protein